MEQFIFEIFENIQFYNRYKQLSERTRKSDARFEETEKLKILEILKNQGADAKYISKGQFYKIEDVLNNWHLNLHLSIKYGVVEVILGGKNNNTGLIIGGPASLICESLEHHKGIKSEGYIKSPSFGNYEILTEIFYEVLGMYSDFKLQIQKIS